MAHINPEGSLQALLNDTRSFYKKYLAYTDEEINVMTVWTAHTFVIDAFDYTPYLSVTAATRGCGKTVTMKCLESVVHNPLMAGGSSVPAFRRSVSAGRPTILLDEFDSLGPDMRSMFRGVLNIGFERGLPYLLCDPDNGNVVVRLDVFGPKVIGGIGDLDDTVASRSIHLRAIRMLPTETRAEFKMAQNGRHPEGGALRDRYTQWAGGAIPILSTASVDVPPFLRNRAKDIWKPLLLVAQMAGTEWYGCTVDAARALVDPQDHDESLPEKLLADARRVLQDGEERVGSVPFVNRLIAIDDAPWGSYHPDWGRFLTPSKLAAMLRPFRIKPKTMRINGKTVNGYERAAFLDAWLRYLPEDLNSPNEVNSPDGSEEAAA